MRYAISFAERGRDIRLADEGTVESVSDECRVAALAFMSGGSWDKLDLAVWLTGPYARAVRHGGRGERVTALAGAPDVDARALGALVDAARRELLSALEIASQRDGALDFADAALQRGHVREARDADGVSVWVPVDLPRVRLADRVRSLFAADCLNARDAYAGLFVCRACGAIAFDEAAKPARLCDAHKRTSGIVFRGADGAGAVADGTSDT